jgi:hypothetical protein
MKPQRPRLQLVPPPAEIAISERSIRWWEAPEFRALAEVRRAMVGTAVPSAPAETAEESARQAVFWALFEVEHLVRRFALRLEAGEDVRIRSGVYKHEEGRVDFNLRIVEHVEISGGPR